MVCSHKIQQNQVLESAFHQIKKLKSTKLYAVKDVQDELEELTEDSDEIKTASAWQQEIYKIKKEIKVTFKRDSKAPDTQTWFYKFGKLLGRGAFGKVNLALHKLSRKIVAVKSINK